MKLLTSVASELWGLFVDDGSFVFAVIAWILGGVICLRCRLLDPKAEAVLLSIGLAVILVENVQRSARAHAAARPGK
jgi:hypothetical protein